MGLSLMKPGRAQRPNQHNMHIIYYHQYFSTRLGSTGTRSYEMARRLIECGHRVTMVCASDKSLGTPLGQKLQQAGNVKVMKDCEIVEVQGDEYARKLILKDKAGQLKEFSRHEGGKIHYLTLMYANMFGVCTGKNENHIRSQDIVLHANDLGFFPPHYISWTL